MPRYVPSLPVQNDLLTAVPNTMVSLGRSAMQMTEVTDQMAETLAAIRQSVARMDAMLDEAEGPMIALLPAMERLAPLAEHPAVDDLPRLLTIMHEDVLPILERLPAMVERTERLLAVADGTVTLLMLPMRTAVLVADLALWRPLARVRSALVALATDPTATKGSVRADAAPAPAAVHASGQAAGQVDPLRAMAALPERLPA